MGKMDQTELLDLLEKHGIWLNTSNQGVPSNPAGQAEILDHELNGIQLENANLACSAMVRCVFSDSKFRQCNFSSALLMETSFINCEFLECEFVKANLREATAKQSSFKDCKFIKADFSNGDFSGNDLSGSNLNWSLLVEADFRNTNLSGLHLTGARILRSRFYNSVKHKLSEAKDVIFQDIDISPAGDGSIIVQGDGMRNLFDF